MNFRWKASAAAVRAGVTHGFTTGMALSKDGVSAAHHTRLQ